MLSSKSRNTREISDIFHFPTIYFLPERHSAMVLIYIYRDSQLNRPESGSLAICFNF